ncbi:beta-Ala-His dipeptidase-like isoform X2 [Protopterus annectens]|nr:beta-Ala-His dipeptidase-like isoform X2 [Protopterus annectens]
MVQFAFIVTVLISGTVMASAEESVVHSATLLDQVLQHIDNHQDEFVQTLSDWIAIQSDSSNSQLRGEINQMLDITVQKLKQIGAMVELADAGSYQLPNGSSETLPQVILAELKKDPNKPTVCIYGHVDVQPASMSDGWATYPYNLTELNGNLYGRGATDNKGPVLAWLHAVEAYQALNQELPVNIKFIIEAMEEVGSPGLDQVLTMKRDTFFSDVDYIVISDNIWLSRKPALTYGTRGNCYFLVEVESSKRDLHSGVFGGAVHEAMTDLIALLGSLVDASGRILIPGINECVTPLTEEEKELYKNIEFDIEAHIKNIGAKRFLQDTKENVLLHLWRYPSLSIHGIEGAFSSSGTKTVIPAKVIGKFSIRQVPDMDPLVVEKQVTEYLNKIFAERNSPNTLKVSMVIGVKPWVADPSDPQYTAGRRAVKKVFNVEPDMIREGSTIPIANAFQNALKKRVMMLPIGGFDDGEHSQNEKISRYNYIQGTKLFATYFHELSKL